MTAINSPAATEARVPQAVVTRVGGALVRYGLVVVNGWIGLLKFTSHEAQGIQPLVANSPFMGWIYEVFSVTTSGDIGPHGVPHVGLTGIIGLGGLPGRPRPRAVASRPMPSGYSLDRAR